MGTLIVWNVMSLDGFFEGTEPWDLRLHEHIWGDDLYRLSLDIGDEIGLLVLGRRTYEGFVEHWPENTDQPDIAAYMNAVPKLVASRTLTEATWANTEITADAVAEVARRKAADDRPAYVFGSAELVDSLLAAGLVDEYLVGVAPVLLGAGNRLFRPAEQPRPLTLIDSRATDTGGALLRYRVG